MKRRQKRLRLSTETVRHLGALDLQVARGGWAADTDECNSAYTYCAKYCSD